MRVSLIIPHRDRWQELKRCLVSIEKMSPQPDEIIIVDDASNCYETLQLGSGLKLLQIRLERHRGSAAAKNEGVRRAKGEYIWFLDSDSEVVRSDTLAQARQYLDKYFLGALGAEGVWDAQGRQWMLKLKYLYPNCDTKEELAPAARIDKAEVDVIATCNLFMSKQLFEDMGGFCELLSVGEDKELCWRLRASGYSLCDSRYFLVAHHAAASQKDTNIMRFFFTNHTNQLAVAFISLPLKELLFLPIIDLVCKYKRFKQQSAAAKQHACAAHGPQAERMLSLRQSLIGRARLYMAFIITLPFSYLYTILRIPVLIVIRQRSRRMVKRQATREVPA